MSIWKRLRKTNLSGTEALLRKREPYCVSAISRFYSGILNNVWAAGSPQSAPSALLFYGRRLLFPVFNFSQELRAEFLADGMPLPFYFFQLLKDEPLHAAQGLSADMELLEAALRKKQLAPSSSNDYELRTLTQLASVSGRVPGLIIRRPKPTDANALFPLQAGYEKEEVLPPGARFDPAACRKGVEHLIAEGMVLTAELEGQLVGKVNINAQSYTCLQIGGVYVLPQYRSRGIAQTLTAALIRELSPLGKRFTLFVKEANAPARRAYEKTGFAKIGRYRISYYG